MLTAHIEIISILAGALPSQRVVTYGIAAVETDTLLQARRIGVILDFGDGTTVESGSTGGRYDLPVVVDVAANGAQLTITKDLLPYTGTFSLSVTAGPTTLTTAALNGRSSAAEVAAELSKISALLFSGGQVLSSEDLANGWRLLLGNELAAAGTALGANSLRSAHEFEHVYPVGNFVAQLTAFNYRSPVADSIVALAELDLSAQTAEKPPSATVYGPILPADVGFPNSTQWSYNLGKDLKVLASSVKMILITQPGERVMLPEYGCDVRRLLFDPNDSSTEQDVDNSIRQAITKWEPRVEIASLTVGRSDRSATVSLLLVSMLNRERFQLKVDIEP